MIFMVKKVGTYITKLMDIIYYFINLRRGSTEERTDI